MTTPTVGAGTPTPAQPAAQAAAQPPSRASRMIGWAIQAITMMIILAVVWIILSAVAGPIWSLLPFQNWTVWNNFVNQASVSRKMFTGLVILAIVVFLLGAVYGAWKIWNDGKSVWPMRFFYLTVGIAFAALAYWLFTLYLGPTATQGLQLLAEDARQDLVRPLQQIAANNAVPDDWSLADLFGNLFHFNTIVPIAAGLLVFLYFTSKGEKK